MRISAPQVGLVVRYNYLWRYEADRNAGAHKDRPVCIVTTVRRRPKKTEVVLLPITHARPRSEGAAIELPAAVKSQLGVDVEPSWVIVTECNVDTWPNPDIVPIPGGRPVYAYGLLPQRFFERIRDAFVAAARSKHLRIVPRDELP